MTELTMPGFGSLTQGLDALFTSLHVPEEEEAPAQPASPPRAIRASDPDEDARLCLLVERIAGADQKSLEALYDATVGRVFAMARGITRNLQCAEEVTEDVYWQVWRQALRFDRRRGPVMAWLLTLARSRSLDHLRKRDDALSHPEPELLRADEDAVHDDDPAAQLAAAQQQRSLNAALDRLDPLPRQLLSLAFQRGLTHDEIAEQTQLPLGTVKSHIRRALLTLRGALGELDNSPEAVAS